MQPTPTMIIIRTDAKHMKGVIDHQKHALARPMKSAGKGALLLIAEKRSSGPALVKYAMWLKAQRPDDTHESEAIWGRRWPFIIDGEGGCELSIPFAPGELKPNGPYGQGGPYVYVLPQDAEDFRRDGRLAPFFSD